MDGLESAKNSTMEKMDEMKSETMETLENGKEFVMEKLGALDMGKSMENVEMPEDFTDLGDESTAEADNLETKEEPATER